jgi:hypothetical protein
MEETDLLLSAFSLSLSLSLSLSFSLSLFLSSVRKSPTGKEGRGDGWMDGYTVDR